MDTERLQLALKTSVKSLPKGFTAIADFMGRRSDAFRQRFSDSTRSPDLDDLYGIIECTGDTSAIDVICEDHNGRFVTKTDVSHDSLPEALMHVTSKVGGVAKAIEDAREDNVITDEEKVIINRAISGAISVLTEARNTVNEA